MMKAPLTRQISHGTCFNKLNLKTDKEKSLKLSLLLKYLVKKRHVRNLRYRIIVHVILSKFTPPVRLFHPIRLKSFQMNPTKQNYVLKGNRNYNMNAAVCVIQCLRWISIKRIEYKHLSCWYSLLCYFTPKGNLYKS